MNEDDSEPVERLEEMIAHPADKTFNTLHDNELVKKKELTKERDELQVLLSQVPHKKPKEGSAEYAAYMEIEKQIKMTKEKISKKHDELMEILKNEENLSREIQDKDS